MLYILRSFYFFGGIKKQAVFYVIYVTVTQKLCNLFHRGKGRDKRSDVGGRRSEIRGRWSEIEG